MLISASPELQTISTTDRYSKIVHKPKKQRVIIHVLLIKSDLFQKQFSSPRTMSLFLSNRTGQISIDLMMLCLYNRIDC